VVGAPAEDYVREFVRDVPRSARAHAAMAGPAGDAGRRAGRGRELGRDVIARTRRGWCFGERAGTASCRAVKMLGRWTRTPCADIVAGRAPGQAADPEARRGAATADVGLMAGAHRMGGRRTGPTGVRRAVRLRRGWLVPAILAGCGAVVLCAGNEPSAWTRRLHATARTRFNDFRHWVDLPPLQQPLLND